jgi:hypothetical protein
LITLVPLSAFPFAGHVYNSLGLLSERSAMVVDFDVQSFDHEKQMPSNELNLTLRTTPIYSQAHPHSFFLNEQQPPAKAITTTTACSTTKGPTILLDQLFTTFIPTFFSTFITNGYGYQRRQQYLADVGPTKPQ